MKNLITHTFSFITNKQTLVSSGPQALCDPINPGLPSGPCQILSFHLIDLQQLTL